MEKYTKFTDPGTGIQPFLPLRPKVPAAGARRVLIGFKNFVLGPLLALVRAATLAIVAMWMVLMTGISMLIPVALLRRGFSRYAFGLGGRIVLLLSGFWWVQTGYTSLQRGRGAQGARPRVPASDVGSGDLIVANHVSYLDVLYLQFRFAPVFVHAYQSRAGGDPATGVVERISWLKALYRSMSAPKAEAAPDTKLEPLAAVLADARVNCSGPVVVFAEGTTSNGLSVLAFTPALENVELPAGCKVQLVAFRYPHDDFSPVYSAGSAALHIFRLLCQPYNLLHVSYLPLGEAALPADADRALTLEAHWGACLVQMMRVRRARLGVADKVQFLQYYGSKERGYKRSKRD